MRFKAFFVRVLVLLCLVSILGCAATIKRAYKGPELSRDKIARILISANVNLISLDGEAYPREAFQMTTFYFIDVLPGAHTIKILPVPQQFGYGNVRGQVFMIDFTADANNTYETKFVLYNVKHEYNKVTYQSSAWIQNRTRYNRALNYFNQGQYEKAIAECDKALENSTCPFTYMLRGCSYHEVEKYEKAIADFDESFKSSPEFFQVYENRGKAYFMLGNYAQAISDYGKAMIFRPENIDKPFIPYAKYDDKSKETLFRIFMYRAEAYLHIDDREKAYLDLKQADELSNSKSQRLIFSLQSKLPEVAKHLINSGADINVINSGNWTPLMYALRFNQPDNAKELINRGADINVKNSDGWTPLMLASKYDDYPEADELKYKEIISILKKAGAK
ncbi:MAG TPA: hypothetical protein DD641_09880 [Deltaproteobacteria bacterium]|nr:hypothetical protein [Deltaproteobacteria bacterium]